MSTMALGILFGLLAALCQSLCYVFSRAYVTRPGNRSSVLFGLSHVQMGVLALALLPFCLLPVIRDVGTYAWPLLGAVTFYLIGQFCLFQAVKLTDASRVAPLLGLKILVLGFTAAFFLGRTVSSLQWGAIFLSVAAALALNYSGGGGIPGKALLAVLGACVGYSFSDLCIVAMTRSLAPHGEMRGILLATALSYMLTMPVGLALVAARAPEHRTPEKWKLAAPVALTWFAAMIFLFICFRNLDAVFGNIVQSLRGPISVLMGVILAAHGHVHLERKVGRWVLARRIGAALLMCAAIGIFAHERSRMEKARPAPEPSRAVQSKEAI